MDIILSEDNYFSLVELPLLKKMQELGWTSDEVNMYGRVNNNLDCKSYELKGKYDLTKSKGSLHIEQIVPWNPNTENVDIQKRIELGRMFKLLRNADSQGILGVERLRTHAKSNPEILKDSRSFSKNKERVEDASCCIIM